MFRIVSGRLQFQERPVAETGAVQSWLSLKVMQDLMELEASHCLKLLPKLFGYRLLQLGAWGYDSSFAQESPMPSHWVLGLRGGTGVQADCDGQALPVLNKSVDVVLLPHSMEMVSSPHRLLREVDRVLCDHGHVLILGFNPLSTWGLRRLWPWGETRPPKNLRTYPLWRVCDWLELLDFEVLDIQRFGNGFPFLRRDGTDIRLHWLRRALAWGCPVYLLLARKRVIPVTPIRRPAWRQPQVVAPVAMPGARSQSRNSS